MGGRHAAETEGSCDGANGAGGWLAGFVPHRLPGGKIQSAGGLPISSMWEGLKGYCSFGTEPDLDCVEAGKAIQALQHAECVISVTTYESEFLKSVSTLLLPMTPFTENTGTFVNIEGVWQSFNSATVPLADSRPAWKIFRRSRNTL